MRTVILGATLAVALLGGCDGNRADGCEGSTCGDGSGGSGASSLEELVVLPAACATDDDCCVVYEPCQAQAYVVLASDYEQALTWAAEAPQESCVRCLTPSVEVRCVEGRCAGFELSYDDPAYDSSRVAHCGNPAVAAAAGADAAGADAAGARVLGCGS